jgi:hypothetical protein
VGRTQQKLEREEEQTLRSGDLSEDVGAAVLVAADEVELRGLVVLLALAVPAEEESAEGVVEE